jgi:hypothetical protein
VATGKEGGGVAAACKLQKVEELYITKQKPEECLN